MDSNILEAIEDTMRNRPNGYFATKFYELFDKDDSPFNPKGEHFVNMIYALKQFYAIILKTGKKFDEITTQGNKIKTKMESLFKKLTKSETAFDKLNKVVGAYISTIESAGKKFNQKKYSSPVVNIKVEAKSIVTKLSEIYTLLDKFYQSAEKGGTYVDIRLHSINGILDTFHLSFLDFRKDFRDIFSDVIFQNRQTIDSIDTLATIMRDIHKEKSLSSKPQTVITNDNRKTNVNPNKKGFTQAILQHFEQKQEGTSFLGSVIGFFAKLGLIIASLGFIKKFLDETELGKQIKTIIKNVFAGISKVVGDWLQGGNLTNLMTDGLTLVADTLAYLFGGIMRFFERNGDKITEALSAGWGVIRDKIIIPGWNWLVDTIWNNIKASFAKNLEEQQKKSGGDDWFDKILDPIIAALKTSIPYVLGGAVILGLISAILAPILGPLLIVPLAELLLGALGAAFSNPVTGIIAGLAVIGVSIWAMHEQYKQNTEIMNDIYEHNEKLLGNLKKRQDMNKDDLTKARDKFAQDGSRENWLEMKRREIQHQAQKFEEDLRKDVAEAKTHFFQKGRIEEAQRKYDEKIKRLEQNSNLNAILKELREIEEKKGIDSSRLDGKYQPPTPKTIKPHDAIIVEPHTKDQVVMAKKDGPIDMALKDMSIRMDQLMSLIATGFTSVAGATMQSGQHVAQAVASSGGGGGGDPGSFSGSDPLRELRDRAARAVEGFNR